MNGSTSDFTHHLEVVVSPEVGEGLLGTQLLDAIHDLLSSQVGITFIPTLLDRKVSFLQI